MKRNQGYRFVSMGIVVLSLCACLGSNVNTDVPGVDAPGGFAVRPNPALPAESPTPSTIEIDGPVVTPEQPTGVVSGTVVVAATPKNAAASRVEFFANGISIGVAQTAPYQVSLNTTNLTTPTVRIKARADSTGAGSAMSPEITYTIDNQVPTFSNFTVLSGNSQDPPGTFSGVVDFSIVANDNLGVARVEFLLGNQVVATTTQRLPGNIYHATWDSLGVQNGSYVIKARVVDVTAVGNPATTPTIPANIANPGAVITFTSPADNTRVSGTILVRATATDATGVTALVLTAPAGISDTNPAPDIFEANIDTTVLPEGALTLTAQATNGLNHLTFKTIRPIVDNIPFDGATALAASPSTGGDFGVSVAIVGDVNGDTFDDIVVGGPQNNVVQINSGVAVIYFGPDFNNQIVINNPAPGINAGFGSSITPLGDIDGDGRADFAISAPGARLGSIQRAGAAYVYKGQNYQTPQVLNAPATQSGESFGWAMAGKADVNGDGQNDLLVTAPFFNGPGPLDWQIGRAFVFYGPSFTSSQLISLPTADMHYQAQFGLTAAMLGLSTGDNQTYFAIGAPNFDYTPAAQFQNAGKVYLYRGNTTTPHVALSEVVRERGATFGAALAAAGDVNNDGYQDILVGVPFAATNQGKAYLLYGPNFSLNAPIFKPGGAAAGDIFGSSVAGVGDVDGDGQKDIAIGASGIDRAYVLRGPGFSQVFERQHPSAQTGIGFGASMAGMGDINHDGLGDLVVGAPGLGPNGGGAAVFFNR